MVSGGLYVRLYRCLNSECGVRNAELVVSASPMIEKLGYAFVQFRIQHSGFRIITDYAFRLQNYHKGETYNV